MVFQMFPESIFPSANPIESKICHPYPSNNML